MLKIWVRYNSYAFKKCAHCISAFRNELNFHADLHTFIHPMRRTVCWLRSVHLNPSQGKILSPSRRKFLEYVWTVHVHRLLIVKIFTHKVTFDTVFGKHLDNY